jgi:enoyl-CoA hydratase/carnithine racemase
MSDSLSFENLRYEKKDQIAFITIARPKLLNALNALTMQELSRALQSVRDDDDVRVAILTGEGEKAFVAGADINEFSGLAQVMLRRFPCAAKPSFRWLRTAASRSSRPSTALPSAAAANSPLPARSPRLGKRPLRPA